MRRFLVSTTACLAVCAGGAGLIGLASECSAAEPSADLSIAVPSGPGESLARTSLVAKLDRLDAWLGSGANGDAWRNYLEIGSLRDEIAKGAEADPAVVSRTQRQLRTEAKGVDLAPFAEVRTAAQTWAHELRKGFGDDLSELAWSSRHDFLPISAEEFRQIRGAMRARAGELEQAWKYDPKLAESWKAFLHWEWLEPHFSDDHKATRAGLQNLDEVIRRFHANEPGLELPSFTNLAKAIERYRGTVSWTEAEGDRRTDYERLMRLLQELFTRHAQKPTTETAWKIARILRVVDELGQSADLIAGVKQRLGLSNAAVQISSNVVRRLPERGLNQRRPVNDCILGTTIRGYADTHGNVEYELLQADDHVRLALHLRGEAHSRTTGFHDPVRIQSTGHTRFGADKTIAIRDEAFTASPAVAFADTNTRIHSISKTGGKFARKLVEKIAWQRAREQKPQGERISEGHTRERIAREYDETAGQELQKARLRYERDVRDALIRRGYSPSILKMSSTPANVNIESAFGAVGELTAGGPPPALTAGHDVSLQVHESAVNNYLPIALAGATISQEAAETQPALKGRTPPWLKKLASANPSVAKAASTGAKPAAEDSQQSKQPPAFKPWSITLNSEAPVSVRFDDGKLALRVRASQLTSLDDAYENWDFIVTYKVTYDGERIVLKRTGDIEVFPTGFDPGWDTRLNSQQSAFRSTLAKNMNARAKKGQGFPAEIPIQPVRLARVGALVLREFSCDDGWLSIGWGLPEAGIAPVLAPAN